MLGYRVKGLREAKKWSQKRLLEEVKRLVGDDKLARNTLSEIENGHYKSESGAWLLEAMAHTLNTSVDYLIGLDDDPGVSIPKLPVPELDIAPLVALLNAMEPGDRARVRTIFDLILELGKYSQRNVDARNPDTQTVVQIYQTASAEEMREYLSAAEKRLQELREENDARQA